MSRDGKPAADGLRARLAAALDREAAVALLRAAVAIPSVTGDEAAFGAFVADRLRRIGAEDVAVEDVSIEGGAPGRPNVWGTVRGSGGGRRLMVAGHLDTVHVRGWAEAWAGDVRADPFGGAIVDGALWGRGAGDLKAGICAGLAARELLARAGIRLRGDVVFLHIADEESGEPGSGVSAGMRAAVPLIGPMIGDGRIPRPDFAIYVEPTRLDVYTAQIGFFIADITVTGRSAYFGVPELGIDALKATHEILAAIWRLSATLEARAPHPLTGGSFLLVTGIEGGGYIAVPGRCRMSLIAKLRPGLSLEEVRQALEQAVRTAPSHPDITVDIAYPAGRDAAVGGEAFETDDGIEPVRLLRAAVQECAPDAGRPGGAPFWSEGSFLAGRLGIPTVYCAPGDIRNCHTFSERVPVEEYLAGIEAFALFMARYCGHDLAAGQP